MTEDMNLFGTESSRSLFYILSVCCDSSLLQRNMYRTYFLGNTSVASSKNATHAISFCVLFVLLNVLASAVEVSHDGRALIIDGKRRVLQSGSIHYPRSTPEVFFLYLFLTKSELLYYYYLCVLLSILGLFLNYSIDVARFDKESEGRWFRCN